MTTPDVRPKDLRERLRGSTVAWPLRAAVAILAMVLVGALIVFVYPWLVGYGLIG